MKKFSSVLKVLMFVGVALIVLRLYPSIRTQFNYTYHEGKPWSHDLVTAEFDFPIAKSAEHLKEDTLAVLAVYTPYFRVDEQVKTQELADLNAHASELGGAAYSFLSSRLAQLYREGIINTDDETHVKQASNITVLDSKHNSKVVETRTCHTLRQAYDTLMSMAQHAQVDLQDAHVENYLKANLIYDVELSRLEKERLLSNISLTKGIVQAGERVIDRGDVVTSERLEVLNSMKQAYAKKEQTSSMSIWTLVGEFAVALTFILLFLLYLYMFRRNIFDSWRDLSFFACMILMMVALAALVNDKSTFSVYLVPYALLPVMVRMFYDGRTALFCHWCTVLLISLLVPSPWEFVLVEVAAGMVAVSSLRHLMQRSQLAQTAIWVGVVTCLVYTAVQLTTGIQIKQIDTFNYVYLGVSALLILAAYGFIYLFERIFRFTSSITLVELTNVDSELMIKFSEVAPGTFQHSLQVSNLAMEAANQVGANSLLVRCGALYHDIGKMAHPECFIENQQGGKNPLLELTPEEAAQRIISHVQDGAQMARHAGLPQAIINFIEMHHGTSLTRYFYNTWQNEHPGETPQEDLFRYKGPQPQSKETAILMMADAVEAASRSLSEYTAESLAALVNRIVDAQMLDGQLRQTPLSFRDVETIKACFTEKLQSMYHHRIAYPDVKAEGRN